MSQPLRVLLVEDNPLDADLLVEELRSAGIDFALAEVRHPVTTTAHRARLSPGDSVLPHSGDCDFPVKIVRLMQCSPTRLPSG